LSNDQFRSRTFDFMLANPPYGKSWKTDLERMSGEGSRKDVKDPRFVIEHADDPDYSLEAKLTLSEALARKIFVDGDATAGVQAFLAGEIQIEGDLAKVVAMQTVEPSAPQLRLTRQIAAITA
jgi:type I restriction-modification system DNA methylase subunit